LRQIVSPEEVLYAHLQPKAIADKLNGFYTDAASRLKLSIVDGAAAFNAGTAQVETATVVGTISTAGRGNVVVTSTGMAGSPLRVPVEGLEAGDDASAIATKIRAALTANEVISAKFTVSGATDKVILTAKVKAANDTSLNIAISDGDGEGACVGITEAATSANTTAGVAPVSGAVSLPTDLAGINAILAIVASSGAAATKLLLEEDTDYTYSTLTNTLVCKTDQSANLLVVFYH
jgi:phage tail sheath gpL-like